MLALQNRRSLLSVPRLYLRSNASTTAAKASTGPSLQGVEDWITVSRKRNIRQSPLKMKFLLTLIRDAWVPDALAQLKFSPKIKSPDVAKILNRAIAAARSNHSTIPEELFVKEVMVTKGAKYSK